MQAAIWTEWHRADQLAADGKIEEAAALHAAASLAEEEFLWGPVDDREAWLAERTRVVAERYRQERADS